MLVKATYIGENVTVVEFIDLGISPRATESTIQRLTDTFGEDWTFELIEPWNPVCFIDDVIGYGLDNVDERYPGAQALMEELS